MSVDNFPRWLACLGLVSAVTAGSVGAEEMGSWKDLGNAVLADGQLRWTKNDNGQDVSWDEARAHCARLGPDWRLPDADELANLHDGARRNGDSAACGDATCNVPPLFKLSGNWYWSGTEVNKDAAAPAHVLAWGVLLVNGRRTQTFKFMPHGARALCVQAPASM